MPDPVIVIDPGHGGRHPGAKGCGLVEKDVVLDVARLLAVEMKRLGLTPVLTREADVTLSLTHRIAVAAEHKALAFVSLHCNAVASAEPRGYEWFIADPAEQRLNSKEQHVLAAYLDGAVSVVMSDYWSMRRRGIKSDKRSGPGSLTVLRNNFVPATLFEIGFLSSPDDAAVLAMQEFRLDLAASLAHGLDKYCLDTLELS